ncbi:polysaccharide deacetylase family protein [Terriglobus saanensis]|uniref:Polysaccharide deacetylase n=1 Tax=Terriglobus saanensis (strain ATCC BAA-1853 / DSM 23119 / SP1PR4) TaxID=401053 RepID=E8V8M6_TERSS|nr:polysaccharide deacetylase family protein [Terriglobus saanensis]ADV84063.1 polysaccharide deacetylase [Terriglobus saanensis SP1PR4]
MPNLVVTALPVAVLGLSVGLYLYAGQWPTSQIFGATLQPGRDPDEIALTYDDGPSPAHTPELLDILAAHGARATFFLVGNHVLRHPQLARRIAEAGHLIGNHTQTHPNLLFSSPDRVRLELDLCQRTIFDTTGITPAVFRPPFGGRRPDALKAAREIGLTPVLWNVTAHDWVITHGPDKILAYIDRGLAANRKKGRGSTILLHDASHLDTLVESHSRKDTLEVTRRLLGRPGLRFTTPEAWV